MYKLLYTEKVIKQLSKIDKGTSAIIRKWIDKNIARTEDPRITGKALSGNKKSYWRYRIGDYRLIVEIKDKELVLIAVDFGHRSYVYK